MLDEDTQVVEEDVTAQQVAALDEGRAEQAEVTSSEEAVKDEGPTYLGDDDLGKHHKFKHDGEEFDMPMSEIVELAQKGKLYDQKQHELAELKRSYESRDDVYAEEEEPVKTQVPLKQQVASDGQGYYDRIHAYAVEQSKRDDVDLNSPAMVIASENAKAIQDIHNQFNTLGEYLNGNETQNQNKAKEDSLTDQFDAIGKKYGIEDEEKLLGIYSASRKEGWPDNKLVEYYEWANREGIAEAGKTKAAEEAAAAERDADAAGVRPSSKKRASASTGGKSVKEMTERELRSAQAQVLAERGL